MPKYNVILYSLHWLKYSNIDAETPREAIQLAHAEREPDAPAVPEDAEDLPQEALVDLVADEDHTESRRYDLEFFDGQVVALPGGEASLRDRAMTLLRQIARMSQYNHEMPEDGEDAMLALNELIEDARRITGHLQPPEPLICPDCGGSRVDETPHEEDCPRAA